MLDVLVTEVSLQSSGIVAPVGQGEAAGVPQHMRVSLKAERSDRTSAVHEPSKTCRGEGRTPL